MGDLLLQPTRFYFEKAQSGGCRRPVGFQFAQLLQVAEGGLPNLAGLGFLVVSPGRFLGQPPPQLPQFGQRLAALLVVFLVARLDPGLFQRRCGCLLYTSRCV